MGTHGAWGFRVGAKFPSCHSGLDRPLAAADAVPRGSQPPYGCGSGQAHFL